MKISDLLHMSMSSLFKRKLRTILTVLGVVIGIASIVIMVSLGLGLNQQQMNMIEQYGGLKTITVTEGSSSGGNGSGDSSSSTDLSKKLTDDTVNLIKSMDHAAIVSPVLDFDMIIRTGAYTYQGYGANGYTLEALEDMKWKFSEGELPKEGDPLKFIYGNLILQEFNDASGDAVYYSTGEVPDIDLMKDPLFVIFDTEAYMSTQNPQDESPFDAGTVDDGSGGTAEPKTPPKKYIIPTAGVLYGDGPEDYKDYSYGVYCDIEPLIAQLKKVYRGKAIPGQPTKKNGQPYKELYYSSIYVKADDVENVKDLQTQIQNLGYEASSNTEWIEQTKKTSEQQQAMLGGIGAVALLVAAIGIANTMMMSIYERTKEIGIMKVLGCDLGDIRSLFLIEAALIGMIGGVVGDLLSLSVSCIINSVTGEKTSLIPVWLYLIGLGFAVFVGVAAGFFPSKRAMELSPLSAIKNE